MVYDGTDVKFKGYVAFSKVKLTGEVKINTDNFDEVFTADKKTKVEGVYEANKVISKISGTMDANLIKADSFKLIITDSADNVVLKRDIEKNRNWEVDNVGFVMGYNKVIAEAIIDGVVYLDEIVVKNNEEGNFNSNLDIDIADNDGDGLKNYMEAEIGSDKNKADTDCDGLNDYVEALVVLTSPLKTDTDGDGTKDIEGMVIEYITRYSKEICYFNEHNEMVKLDLKGPKITVDQKFSLHIYKNSRLKAASQELVFNKFDIAMTLLGNIKNAVDTIYQCAVFQANNKIFEDNMFLLDLLKSVGNRSMVREASEDLIENISKSYGDIIWDSVKDNLDNLTFDILLTIAGGNPIIKTFKIIRDLSNIFFKLDDKVESVMKMLAYDSACEALGSFLKMTNNVGKNGKYVCSTVESDDVYILYEYSIINVCQLRIVAENEYANYKKLKNKYNGECRIGVNSNQRSAYYAAQDLNVDKEIDPDVKALINPYYDR